MATTELATFAAGCFWGIEAAFRELLGRGVVATRVGYTGGHTRNPTYEEVCAHHSGHAEAVEIAFDPSNISYADLLTVFWRIHDPTDPPTDAAGNPSQYRSEIFYHSSEQQRCAEESKAAQQASGKVKGTIRTAITPAAEFYPAEQYHQQYYAKHGIRGGCHFG